MPPLGLSAGVRRARELGRRTAGLILTSPRMVHPRAQYAARPHDGILVLQRGENASTDYYLRGRLQAQSAPAVIVDTDSAPEACSLLGEGGAKALLVIVCRYASGPWLDALEAAAAEGRLARVAFFMDDDLPEMMRDATLPAAARGKVAAHYGGHVRRLEALASEVWVSTPALSERYAAIAPRLLTPAPEADPPEIVRAVAPKAVYHGTDVHGRERKFVVEIARRLVVLDPSVLVEIVGDAALRRACAGMENVSVVPQLPWPQHLERSRREPAALSLAPLFPSPLNAARAPVKAFDAARLGAAGLYADVEPYRGFVRDGEDGLLLPMRAEAWVEAIIGILAAPERRMALAATARARLINLRREASAFPLAPGA